MRKIVSKQEEEKKKRRNQFIIGSVLIFVMMASVLGYAFQNYLIGNTVSTSNSTQTVSYNGLNFENQNGYWAANYSGKRIVFTYLPNQIPFSNVTLADSIKNLTGKPLYIYSEDFNSTSEVELNLLPFVSQINQTQQVPKSGDCTNNFIIIQNGPSQISQYNNCIYISGQGQDLIINVDNVLFKLFGIEQ